MKAKARANNITSKKCAFCKNWYDPANSAIKPCGTITWEYEVHVQGKESSKKGISIVFPI